MTMFSAEFAVLPSRLSRATCAAEARGRKRMEPGRAEASRFDFGNHVSVMSPASSFRTQVIGSGAAVAFDSTSDSLPQTSMTLL